MYFRSPLTVQIVLIVSVTVCLFAWFVSQTAVNGANVYKTLVNMAGRYLKHGVCDTRKCIWVPRV